MTRIELNNMSAAEGNKDDGKTRLRDEATVFVRNIPVDTGRLDLEDYFSEYGPVKKCSIIQPKGADSNHEDGGDEKDGGRRPSKLLYGFIKFVNAEDAVCAVDELTKKRESRRNADEGGYSNLIMELASSKGENKKHREKNFKKQGTTHPHKNQNEEEDPSLAIHKKNARVIVRNLSFYATANQVEKALQEYGTIMDVHLPTVAIQSPAGDAITTKKHVPRQQHRGFAFVTFEHANQAAKAAQASKQKPVSIQKRDVVIELSISKERHKHQQQLQKQRINKEVLENHENKVDVEKHDGDTNSNSEAEDGGEAQIDVAGSSNDDSSDSDAENDSMSEASDDEGSGDDNEDDDDPSALSARPAPDDVKEQRTLFVRNIPFDANRHALFELFKEYGKIDSIFLVKDKITGVCKGTAFVKYFTGAACERAMEVAGESSFSATPFVLNHGKAGGAASMQAQYDDGGILFQGRRLLVDMAVDKQLASSLTADRDENGKVIKRNGKDKRNLYLRTEGYISTQVIPGVTENDPHSWEMLPPGDQLKRERAWNEKKTKLRSPIFFINSYRLSVRNLAKHVDKSQLKKLAVEATQEGMRCKNVTTKDVAAHLMAQGTPPRECLGEAVTIPAFNVKNVKEYIPSAYVSHEDSKSSGDKKSAIGESKGFGFIEFTHHAHALTCLRELNNNPKYSSEFVTRGKVVAEMKANAIKKIKKGKTVATGKNTEFMADDGKRVKVPRLVVEFTVENKAKAKLQADRRLKLQAAAERQKLEQEDLMDEAPVSKKKNRGKKMREKKRQLKEMGVAEEAKTETAQQDSGMNQESKKQKRETAIKDGENISPKSKVKKTKPPKKARIDRDEAKLAKLVQSHLGIEKTVEKAATAMPHVTTPKKRWFE
jgi:nucleolar protein 4